MLDGIHAPHTPELASNFLVIQMIGNSFISSPFLPHGEYKPDIFLLFGVGNNFAPNDFLTVTGAGRDVGLGNAISSQGLGDRGFAPMGVGQLHDLANAQVKIQVK